MPTHPLPSPCCFYSSESGRAHAVLCRDGIAPYGTCVGRTYSFTSLCVVAAPYFELVSGGVLAIEEADQPRLDHVHHGVRERVGAGARRLALVVAILYSVMMAVCV